MFLGAIFVAGATAASILVASYPVLQGLPVELVATVASAIGTIFLIFGIIELAIAVDFFGGKGWAWTLGIIANIILIIVGILTLPGSILGLIINILILYYLTRLHVKVYFGMGPPMGPAMGSVMMTASTMGFFDRTRFDGLNNGALSQLWNKRSAWNNEVSCLRRNPLGLFC